LLVELLYCRFWIFMPLLPLLLRLMFVATIADVCICCRKYFLGVISGGSVV
jgi:hypothetical protein